MCKLGPLTQIRQKVTVHYITDWDIYINIATDLLNDFQGTCLGPMIISGLYKQTNVGTLIAGVCDAIPHFPCVINILLIFLKTIKVS
jgi:hypothetical protein